MAVSSARHSKFKILLRDVDGPPIPRGTVHPDPLVIGSTRIRMVERGCRPPRRRGGVGPIDGNHLTSEFELNVSSVVACDSNVAWRRPWPSSRFEEDSDVLTMSLTNRLCLSYFTDPPTDALQIYRSKGETSYRILSTRHAIAFGFSRRLCRRLYLHWIGAVMLILRRVLKAHWVVLGNCITFCETHDIQ
jgi:hypothetical protein